MGKGGDRKGRVREKCWRLRNSMGESSREVQVIDVGVLISNGSF